MTGFRRSAERAPSKLTSIRNDPYATIKRRLGEPSKCTTGFEPFYRGDRENPGDVDIQGLGRSQIILYGF